MNTPITSSNQMPLVNNVVPLLEASRTPRLVLLDKNGNVLEQIESTSLFMSSGSGDDLSYGSAWAEIGYADPNKGTNEYSKNTPKWKDD